MNEHSTEKATLAGRLAEFFRTGGGLAALAGAIVVFSFAPFGCGPLIFLAPVLLLSAVRGHGPKAAFWRGYVMGLVIEGGGFYWIVHTIAAFADVHWLVAVGVFCLWLLLSSIFWGLWALCVRSDGPWGWRWWVPAVSLACLELLFPRVFPWNLSAGFAGWPVWMQAARWVGVEGLSILTVLVGTLCHHGWIQRETRAGKRSLLTVLAVLGIWSGLGFWRLSGDVGEHTVRVGYLQPNVSLHLRHRGTADDLRVFATELLRDTLLLGRQHQPSFIIWPEAIWPYTSSSIRDPQALGRVAVPVIAGVGEQRRNRIVLVPPSGDPSPLKIYDKRILLPFGETIPARWAWEWTGFPLNSNLVAGDEVAVWDIGGTPVGVSSCFEAIVPGIGTDLVDGGARLHVNTTEDQWFGDTSEPHQHLALATMRVVESDLPMVRVTNAGITSWVDRFGRVRDATELFTRDVGIFEVAVPASVASRFHSQAMFRYGPLVFLVFIIARRFGNASIRRELPTRP